MTFNQLYRKTFLSFFFLSTVVLFLFSQTNTSFALIPSGGKDFSFDSGDEPTLNNEVFATTLQSDGKIIIGGKFSSFSGTGRDYVARLNSDGSLDSTFNSSGSGASLYGYIRTITIQDDGKILIGGEFTSYNGIQSGYIARLNNDGSLDTTFNNSGIGADNFIYTIAVQQDGKIIVGGNFNTYNGTAINRIARLNSDGTLDTLFTVGSGVNSTVNSIAIQDDDKILIGGAFTTYNGTGINRVARLNTNGALDTSFTVGTGTNNTVNAIVIQNDDKILIGGAFVTYNGIGRGRIARLNADGTLDTSFLGGATDMVKSIAIQDDDKILICGDFPSYNGTQTYRIARLNTNGSLDASFTFGTGAYVNFGINSIAIQNDDKILIGGAFATFFGTVTTRDRFARLNTDGTFDVSFIVGTGASSAIYSMAIQPDGKVIICGNFTTYHRITRNRIARLNTDGSLDTTFDPGTGADDSIGEIAIQEDGKVIIIGKFTSYNGTNKQGIARLNSDGSLDTSFNESIGFSEYGFDNINAIRIDENNKIIVGGRFANYNGTAINNLVRINTDGSIDTSFNSGTGPNEEVKSMIIQQDDKILITGYFTAYNGTAKRYIARLNANGSLDTSFDVGTDTDQSIEAIEIQQDGKVIIGGRFTTYNGVSRNRIARLNSDGSLDTTFDVGTGANQYYISAIAIQQDRKVLIGGNFTTYNGIGRKNIARLNTDGSLDTTFNPGTGMADGSVTDMIIQEDGKVIIGGAFTTYNSSPNPYLVRISGVSLFQIEPPNEDVTFVDTLTDLAPEVGTDYGINSNEVNILMKKLGLPVALMNLDFSLSDLNLSGITSDTDTTTGKAFFHFDDALTTNTCSPNCSFADIPGAVGETYSLYIPKLSGHHVVQICPNATSLADITASCASGYVLKEGNENLSTVTVDDQEYWLVAGLSGTGGMSMVAAPSLSRTGDNMLLSIWTPVSVLVVSMLSPKLYKLRKNNKF